MPLDSTRQRALWRNRLFNGLGMLVGLFLMSYASLLLYRQAQLPKRPPSSTWISLLVLFGTGVAVIIAALRNTRLRQRQIEYEQIVADNQKKKLGEGISSIEKRGKKKAGDLTEKMVILSFLAFSSVFSNDALAKPRYPLGADVWRWDMPRPDERHPLRASLQKPPQGFVSLKALIPSIHIEIRYHTPHNFTGAPLPGYGAPDAWMLEKPAQALAQAQEKLAKEGLSLLVYDAYRPIRASLAMVAWAKRTGQAHLLNGYIARRSGHNHGHTIDLTLCDAKTGKPLDMGNAYDTLNETSHTKNSTGHARRHRYKLLRVMRSVGFRGYFKEWWHFGYRMPHKTAPRDVPYSCYESPEGQWKAPKGWEQAGFTVPMIWKPKPCSQ